MMVKVESFTAKVKRYLRVIVLISSHEREMGAYAVHACHDNRPVVDIHHISHKSQWTKPLNESTVSKIHIGTATESYLQQSSFDSVHFLEFYFFFFANRYGMVERCSL